MIIRQPDQQSRKKIEHYSYGLNEQLGRGYSSCVYKGRDDRTNETVAIKVVDMRMLEDRLHQELLQSQISSLKELKSSQYILKLVDVFATANNTYIITEFCDGKELSHKIGAMKGIPDDQAIQILKQLANGFLQMSKKGIVHRDLKPTNLFFKGGVLKIADFGFAVRVEKCQRPFNYNLGSPSYMSPEALKQNRYSFKSDIWSLGVIAYEMLHNKVPWRSQSDHTLLRLMVNQPIENVITRQRQVSPVIVEFMRRCCCPNISQRMSPEQLASFNWGDQQQVPRFGSRFEVPIQKTPQVTQITQVAHTPSVSHVPQLPVQQVQIAQITQPSMKHMSVIGTQVQIPANSATNNLVNLLKGPPSTTTFNPSASLGQSKPNAFNQTKILQEPMTRKPSTGILNSSLANQQLEVSRIQQAQKSIVSQLQYCRFIHLIMSQLQMLPDSAMRLELLNYCRSQILHKLSLMMMMINMKENVFELSDFNELLNRKQWPEIRQLVIYYNNKFNSLYPGPNFTYNDSKTPIVNTIRQLDVDSHLSLVDKLVTYYQIKLMQQKITYDEFPEKSKIDLIMALPTTVTNAERLKKRMSLLSI